MKENPADPDQDPYPYQGLVSSVMYFVVSLTGRFHPPSARIPVLKPLWESCYWVKTNRPGIKTKMSSMVFFIQGRFLGIKI
jgi:hypothetical protein